MEVLQPYRYPWYPKRPVKRVRQYISMRQSTHIMQVTECVNIEDVRETHCDTQILEETGEHMPGVSL
jgi:hypothetical protein